MRDENVFGAMARRINMRIEHARKPSDMPLPNPSVGSAASVSALAGHLVSRATDSVESNREEAWRYLNDGLILLGAEPGTIGNVWRPGGLASWQAKRTLKYMEDNLASKMTIPEMADGVGLSKSYFSRAFKRSIGSPPAAYVTARRVERAKLMILSGGDTLTDIALACGFADHPHFCKSFRRVVGTSPRVWRRSQFSR
jgi:AraC family transcriptional regulator